MDRRLLFSVTMATYNRAHLLPRAVNSVLNQSYQNFELVIVDDGSTDDTEMVCQSFDDSRIIYHKQEQNSGVLAARNKGFDLARGDYTAILDDDDELLPEALETAVDKFRELSAKGIKMLWFDRLDFERKQRSGFGMEAEGYVRYEDILCERIYGDFWLVMERELIGENDRFDERLWGQENLLWLRLHRKSKAYYVPEVLYVNHREHGGDRLCDVRTRLENLPGSALTNKVFLEEYGEDLKRLCPKVYGRKLGILGASQILNGEKPEGRKLCRESFKYGKTSACCIVFLLSFILSSNQIRLLASNYMRILDIKRQLRRLATATPKKRRLVILLYCHIALD